MTSMVCLVPTFHYIGNSQAPWLGLEGVHLARQCSLAGLTSEQVSRSYVWNSNHLTYAYDAPRLRRDLHCKKHKATGIMLKRSCSQSVMSRSASTRVRFLR